MAISEMPSYPKYQNGFRLEKSLVYDFIPEKYYK